MDVRNLLRGGLPFREMKVHPFPVLLGILKHSQQLYRRLKEAKASALIQVCQGIYVLLRHH